MDDVIGFALLPVLVCLLLAWCVACAISERAYG